MTAYLLVEDESLLPAPLVAASVLVPVEPADDLLCAPEAPDDFAFLVFLDFFLAFGFASVVASVLPAEVPEVDDGEDDVPLVVPVALGLVEDAVEVPDELPLVLGVVDELPLVLGVADEPELAPVDPVLPVPMVDEPEAPVPLVPDVVSLPEPEAPDEDVPLLPDAPDDDEPGWPVLGGIELDVPLAPAMPASLPVPAPVAPVAFCDFTVGDGDDAPLPLDCASAMDDTDATMTNDSERRVFFSVMSNSLNWKKGIIDAAAWMQRFFACSANFTACRCKNH